MNPAAAVALTCLWLLAGLVLAPGTHALDPSRAATQFPVDRFTVDEGLPSNRIWRVREGPEGYLWLATQGGLARFDGVGFLSWSRETHPVLRSNDIRCLEWSPTGDLWLGTYAGGALRLPGGRIDAAEIVEGLPTDTILDIHPRADGSIWFATSMGIARWHDGDVRHWGAEAGLGQLRPYRLAEDAEGRLWVGSLTDGAARFDGERFQRVDAGSAPVHLLQNVPGSGFLVGTDRAVFVARERALEPLEPGPLSPVPVPTVVLDDHDGVRWIGSYGDGLWWQRARGDAVEALPVPGPAPVRYVFDLIEDSTGNVWAATMRGLWRLSDSPFRTFGEPEGIDAPTFVVTGNDSGTVWTGTEGRGLFELTADGAMQRYDTADGLTHSSVSALMQDSRGDLWVGTFGGGVSRFVGSVVEQLSMDTGLSGNHIMAMHEERSGAVWIASNAGLDLWKDGRVEPVPLGDDLRGIMVRHILETADGNLWFASDRGLIQLSTRGLRRWGREDGLVAEAISCLYEDATGTLWVGTHDAGLARVRDGELRNFGMAEGLPQLAVHGILEDGDGYLWLSGDRGLTRVYRASLDAVAEGTRSTVQAELFDTTDGLRSAEFSTGFQPPAWRDPEGHLWFAAQSGLVAVDPGRLGDRDRRPASVEIVSVRVNGESRAVAGDTLRLPADVQSVEIDYTAPDLRPGARTAFRYALARQSSGDKSWVEVNDRRTAYYTALPPRESVFRVQAGSDRQFRADDPTSVLRLYREPLWWETLWAVALATGLLLFLILAVYRLTELRAHRREVRLEQLVERRTRELRSALERVETLSRVDGLTGVANRRFFDQRLAEMWKLGERGNCPLSLILIDIDQFKQYNDSLGHQAGDDCLARIARALSSDTLREHDLVARYGGEEFIVLLFNESASGARQVADRLLHRVRSLNIPHPALGENRHVTISLGVSTGVPGEVPSPQVLIAAADAALYHAKDNGRDQLREAFPGEHHE